ncbi:hypothetical protein FKM82_027864 [Ascaphus truei]
MGLNAASSGECTFLTFWPSCLCGCWEYWGALGAGGACVTGWCGCECAPQNALCRVTLTLPAHCLPLAGAVVGRGATDERLVPFGEWSFVVGGREGGAPSAGVVSQSRAEGEGSGEVSCR